ncbi:MAG: VWA domain-containing protein [Terriglobia bacterium]
MGMTSSGDNRNRKAGGEWKGLAAVLVWAAMAMGAGALRAPAQQASPPATPTAPTAAGNTENPGQGAAPAKTPTIKTTVELVSVPVTALNKRGLPVIDLGKEDFLVFEDGVEQPIRSVERETSTPLRVGLILDTSNSARRQLAYEKEAASEFVFQVLRNGGTKNQVFLQTFDASSSILQDFTSDPDQLNEKIQDLKSGGGKALYDAIYIACREKMRKTGSPEEMRRILVVLSDGLDVQSQHTLDEAVSMARLTETMIYTIGTAAYGFTNPGDKLLAEISSATGGAPTFPMVSSGDSDLEVGYLSHGQIGDTSQNKGLGAETGKFSADRLVHLADALQAISRELDEQYTITYRPLRSALDGTYRNIKVVTVHRGVILRWKPGYFATAE